MVSVSWARITWSHSLDYGGQVSDSLDYGPQNPFNWTSNYGNSNFDVRQRLSLSYIYELPFGRGKALVNQPGIARAILGGWQLSGVTSYQTGLPFTPILSYDPTNTGTTARPNVVAGTALYPSPEPDPIGLIARLLSRQPRILTEMPAATFCAAPTPSTATSDCSAPRLSKKDITCSLRAQAFNVFNTPQFGLPNNTVGVATTGVITTVVTPERQFQLGLHLMF